MEHWQGFILVIIFLLLITVCSISRNTTPLDEHKNFSPSLLMEEAVQHSILIVLISDDTHVITETIKSAYHNAGFPYRIHASVSTTKNTDSTLLHNDLESMNLYLWSTNVQWLVMDDKNVSNDARRALACPSYINYNFVVHLNSGVTFDKHWDIHSITQFNNLYDQYKTARLVCSRPIEGFAAVDVDFDKSSQLPTRATLSCVQNMTMSTAIWCEEWSFSPGFIYDVVKFDPELPFGVKCTDIVYSARLHAMDVIIVHPSHTHCTKSWAVKEPHRANQKYVQKAISRLKCQLGVINLPHLSENLPQSPLTQTELENFGNYIGINWSMKRVLPQGVWGITPDTSPREYLNKTNTISGSY